MFCGFFPKVWAEAKRPNFGRGEAQRTVSYFMVIYMHVTCIYFSMYVHLIIKDLKLKFCDFINSFRSSVLSAVDYTTCLKTNCFKKKKN